jgi:SWI/SNF-related matrix-associated actin-dependent regulator of chromatin subfamily A-like protein 1
MPGLRVNTTPETSESSGTVSLHVRRQGPAAFCSGTWDSPSAAEPVLIRHRGAAAFEDLFPYQCHGVEFLAARRIAFLFDGMGLGKSAQAIRAADAISARRLLIICPAIARTNWARELGKFGVLPRKVQAIASAAEAIKPDADVVIVNYELAAKPAIRRKLLARRFDVLIADEAQALKSRTARRTRVVYGPRCDGQGGLIARAERVWLLAGTPMPNHAGELWTHLSALLPEAVTVGGRQLTHPEFLERYCALQHTQYGPRVVGNRNTTELRRAIEPHVLRRRVEDVLPDLPAVRWTTVVVDPGEALAELQAAEAGAQLVPLRTVLEAATARAELAAGATADRDALIERTLRTESVALARLRRLTGIAKAKATVELLRDELASGALAKVVVFAHHREVLRIVAAGLGRFGVVAIDGDTSPRRQQAIDRFQTEPATRVFLGQITAASTAITLTAASHVVFAEASWVPADNLQAAKRCHRIGQVRPVLVRFISLAGSLDEAITAVLRRKTRLLAELID